MFNVLNNLQKAIFFIMGDPLSAANMVDDAYYNFFIQPLTALLLSQYSSQSEE
jgi:hypothetical protein